MAKKYALPGDAERISDTTGADGVRVVKYRDARKNVHVVRIRPSGSATDTVTTKDGTKTRNSYKVKLLTGGRRLETWKSGPAVNELRIGPDGALEEAFLRTEEKKALRFGEIRRVYEKGKLAEESVVKRDEKKRRISEAWKKYANGKPTLETSEDRTWVVVPGGEVELKSRKKTLKVYGEGRRAHVRTVDEVK
ncbi:MAG: hypothetical protein ACYTFG_07705, partial [Planctomycetota bacterium]